MIIVRNRELLIPKNEQYIGTTYDESSENRQILIPRVTQGGVDLSGLVITLDIEYNTGAHNSVMLTKEVGDEAIILTWPITESQLQIPGTAFISLRAVDNTDASVKWASFKAAVYIEDTIYTPGHWTGDLTELEQYEAAISLELQQATVSRNLIDALYQEIKTAYDTGDLDGRGIESIQLNPDYTLTITMDDGTYYTTASIRGEKGEPGVYVGPGPLPADYDVWVDTENDSLIPEDGGYYTPSVSQAGVLSWTASKSEMDPVPSTIIKGPQGLSINPRGAYSASLIYDKLDVVTYNGSSWVCEQECSGVTPASGAYWTLLASKGDKGDKGDKGEVGAMPAISVGTVTTLEPEEPATVTITGTAAAPNLNFGIPKGVTQDLSEIESDITDLKNELKEYNAVNLLPHLSDRTIDSSGVTGSVTDDVIVVNGTTSAPLNIRYYNRTGTLPEWWIPGRDVYLHFDKTGTGTIYMIFRISKYNSDGSTTLIGEYDTSSVIHIPEDFDGVGLVLTFYIPTRRTVSGSAHAYILNTKSNQELAAETRRVNELKVACFGDSIMWGRDGNGSGSTQTPYTIPNAIAKRLNCVCDNYGVGGQGFIQSDGTPNAYDNISGVDLTAYTVMVMCYGVNDGFDTVGEWDSTDESTIMGQFNKIVNYVYTQNPNIRLIVFAPWPGRNVGSFPDYWYGDVTVASTGRTSRKILSDAMKRACDYYWIPYIEQYDSPINPLNIGTALPDGVHPSNDYYKLIGDWAAAKVSGLL